MADVHAVCVVQFNSVQYITDTVPVPVRSTTSMFEHTVLHYTALVVRRLLYSVPVGYCQRPAFGYCQRLAFVCTKCTYGDFQEQHFSVLQFFFFLVRWRYIRELIHPRAMCPRDLGSVPAIEVSTYSVEA